MPYMSRNALHALVLLAAVALIMLATRNAGAQALSLLPPPVEAGGAMVVTWADIPHPNPTDWIGLYIPGTNDFRYQEWMFVSCSQDPCNGRARGTCGFAIPATVPQGMYELRLFAADSFVRLATSPQFHITNGGGQ